MRRLRGSSSRPAKEGIEDITESEVKPVSPSPEESFTTAMTEAVIGSALIGIRKNFVGFIYFLELLFSPIATVVVGVILKG